MFIFNVCLTFWLSVGVIVCLHSREPKGGDKLTEQVPSQRSIRSPEGGAAPCPSELLVHGRNRLPVCHWNRSGYAAEELLLWEERRFCGSHYLGLHECSLVGTFSWLLIQISNLNFYFTFLPKMTNTNVNIVKLIMNCILKKPSHCPGWWWDWCQRPNKCECWFTFFYFV